MIASHYISNATRKVTICPGGITLDLFLPRWFLICLVDVSAHSGITLTRWYLISDSVSTSSSKVNKSRWGDFFQIIFGNIGSLSLSSSTSPNMKFCKMFVLIFTNHPAGLCMFEMQQWHRDWELCLLAGLPSSPHTGPGLANIQEY